MGLKCTSAGRCSGCDWISIPYAEQRERKTQALREWTGIQNIEFVSAGESGLRDRADLVLKWTGIDFRLGLWSLGPYKDRDIVDLDSCPMMSDRLHPWYLEFRKFVKALPHGLGPVIQLGSLRLRVGLRGERGLWLDFSNVAVKALLDEEKWLSSLMDSGVIVEIGQRRKVLVRKSADTISKTDRLGLDDGVPREWFATWNIETQQAIPLNLNIGGFSQPGVLANRVLVQHVARAIGENKSQKAVSGGPFRVLELGAGNGNLTFSIASIPGVQVVAVENDQRAVESLSQHTTAQTVQVLASSFFKPSPELLSAAAEADVWLCDPSRGGLGKALDWMEQVSARSPNRKMIYVSCDPRALAEDMKVLGRLGISFSQAVIVDQFPQSHHFECIVW